MMTLVQRLLMLDYYAARIVQGLCNSRVSVCLSLDGHQLRPTGGGVATERRLCSRYRSIAASAVLQALSSKCG